jgi:uncharacterized protein YndB with AHSA1/START domain
MGHIFMRQSNEKITGERLDQKKRSRHYSNFRRARRTGLEGLDRSEPSDAMVGPKDFTSPSCETDFRVGGKYLFCMRSDIGPEIWQKGLYSTGVYKEIIPMKKIVCTDCFSDEQGNVVPASYYGMEGEFPLEMMVTITFEVVQGNKTRMTLVHEGLPAGEHTKGATQGWNESFDKLAATFQS